MRLGRRCTRLDEIVGCADLPRYFAGFGHSVIAIKMQREEKFLIKIRSYQVGVSGVHKQAILFISRFAGFVGIFAIGHLLPAFQRQL